MNALITEIERFSVHDGPGIRTTVFLKGCPLHCAWCHNPECISFEKQELFYPEKCIGCGQCAKGCYSGARVVCGKSMTVAEVMEEVLRDAPYYGKEGGVTISGGEPQAQPEFTAALLKACREHGIHTAIETSMYRFDATILSHVDLIMADLKIWNPELHLQYTGIRNDDIIKNLRQADDLNIPMIIRTPVISGVNDTKENISQTAAFLKALRHVIQYELLPYHPLGLSKARALGISATEFAIPSGAKMEELKTYADLSGPVERNAQDQN